MKNLYKSVLVIAAAALTFASCQKETLPEQSTLKTVNFVAQTLETKTAFGTPSGTTYPTLWTATDSLVKVATNAANAKDAHVSAASDGKSASFSLTMTAPEAESFVFDAVSPAAAYVGISATKGWNLNIPTTQTPSANSVDPLAQVLFAESASFSSFPENVDISFSHFTAYGKLNIKNLKSGAAVSSVTLTAETNWAGRWNCNPADGTASENSASATIAINTTSTSNIWFGCAPVDLGGKTIKVTVATDKGNFEKTITIPSGKRFESGKIAEFTVNFSGVEPKADAVYSLVTSTDALTVGSEVIIVGFGDKGNVALSTNQQKNNRATAGVTVESDKVMNPSDAVQVFTLGFGKLGNSVAFDTGAGYIYAASSSENYLRTENELSSNSSFEVKIDGGVASITAQGSNTHNILMYNEKSSCFSCYGSATQKPVKIFKKDGSGTSQKIINGEIEKPVGKTYASLAALVAAGAPTAEGENVTVTLSDEEIVDIYVTGSGYRNGVFVNAGGQKIEIFCYDVPEDWKIGGKISGTVTCLWVLYGGSTWELKPSSWSAFTYKDDDGGTTPPSTGKYTAEITIDSFNGGKQWSSYSNIIGSVTGSNKATYNIAGDNICWNKEYIQNRQSKNSVIYNTSSFGKIKSITIEDSTAAEFTVTVGASAKDGCTVATQANGSRTFSVTGDYGYFKIVNANTTIAHTTKITVSYE